MDEAVDSKPIPSYTSNQHLIANSDTADEDVGNRKLFRVHLHHLDPYGTLVFADDEDYALENCANFYIDQGYDGVFATENDYDSPDEFRQAYDDGELHDLNSGHYIPRDEIINNEITDPKLIDAARALSYLRQLPTVIDDSDDERTNPLKKIAKELEKILWPMN